MKQKYIFDQNVQIKKQVSQLPQKMYWDRINAKRTKAQRGRSYPNIRHLQIAGSDAHIVWEKGEFSGKNFMYL
jgi:hypothetical protein